MIMHFTTLTKNVLVLDKNKKKEKYNIKFIPSGRREEFIQALIN